MSITWAASDSKNTSWSSVCCNTFDPTYVFAVGTTGENRVYISYDSGITWTSVYSGTNLVLTKIVCDVYGYNVMAKSYNYVTTMVYSIDNGSTFNTTIVGDNLGIVDIATTSYLSFYAVVSNTVNFQTGVYNVFNPSTDSWKPILPLTSTKNYSAITISAAVGPYYGAIYVLNSYTEIYISMNGFYSTAGDFILKNTGFYQNPKISMQYDNVVFCSDGYNIYYSNDYALTFTTFVTPDIVDDYCFNFDLTNLTCVNTNNNKKIYTNQNFLSGGTFVLTTGYPNNLGWMSICQSDPQVMIAAPNNNRIFYYNNILCILKGAIIKCEEIDGINEKKIEDLKVGDNLLIHNNTYKKIIKIKYNYLLPNDDDINNPRIYKIDDLLITKYHSFLIPENKDLNLYINHEYYKDCYKLIYKIPGYNKLHAFHHKNCEGIIIESITKYYHIVLESDNVNENFGIYANNYLIETCSISDFDKF